VSTQHIGAAGELLVQYRLLKLGIDSARLTTDAGIDLVVYSPSHRSATTVQVKTNFAPRPSGGRGPLSRGWYLPQDCPAQLIAFVALDAGRVWLIPIDEARTLAQQHSAKGMRQLYWRIEPPPGPGDRLRHETQMSQYLLEVQAPALFP
jgi:hypothetical protein